MRYYMTYVYKSIIIDYIIFNISPIFNYQKMEGKTKMKAFAMLGFNKVG